MENWREQNQLSRQQINTLQIAFWLGENCSVKDPFVDCMRRVLLRAFVIYQDQDSFEIETFQRHQQNLSDRLKHCLSLQTLTQKSCQLQTSYAKFPYWLCLFIPTPSAPPSWQSLEKEDRNFFSPSHLKELPEAKTNPENRSRNNSIYHQFWITLIWKFLAIGTKNPHVVRLKKELGCISLIPIQVDGKVLTVNGRKIHYHDLYHLEVSQLERIRMGSIWVSGVHGINTEVFHGKAIATEYNGFLDEARIAIHEVLTRPSPFSYLKVSCWMILLSLEGINPVTVFIRHMQSMKNKYQSIFSNFSTSHSKNL